MDKMIVVNIDKCLACKSCEIACAVAHSKSKELQEAVAESPRPQRMLSVEAAGEYGVPIQCRHCEAAPCIEICPTGAIRRASDEGPVLVDEDLCIGCKLCLLICPFGILKIGGEGRAIIKCDMCLERLEAGEEPECVAACPTGALVCISIDEHTDSKRKKASQHLAKKSGSRTDSKTRKKAK
jgi:carbon-monoxide dehydrogenase iron sulfur subunit